MTKCMTMNCSMRLYHATWGVLKTLPVFFLLSILIIMNFYYYLLLSTFLAQTEPGGGLDKHQASPFPFSGSFGQLDLLWNGLDKLCLGLWSLWIVMSCLYCTKMHCYVLLSKQLEIKWTELNWTEVTQRQ